MKALTKNSLLAPILAWAILSPGWTHATIITKAPDLGPLWYSLTVPDGSSMYANSFVAPHDSTVAGAGTWLNTEILDPATEMRFQIWGSVGNDPSSGPDYLNVRASTAAITGMNGPLTLYSASTPGSLTLTAGNTYWFVATIVVSPGLGSFQVGGHTQNSVYPDNGTFWFSSEPEGQTFDGTSHTPEMAFQVELVAVPEPSTWLAGLSVSLAALAFFLKNV